MLKNLLTIVIPCKNEGTIISKTLRLLDMQFNIDGVNVIIADISDDNTKEIISNTKLDNIIVSFVKGGLPSIGRNNGASKCKTDYILFLDADMFIQNPSLLNRMVNRMISGNYSLSTTKIRTDNGKFDSAYLIFDIIRYLIKFKTPFAVGGFMLFNTKEFNLKGKFNEEDKFAEDYHLSSKFSSKDFFIDREIVYTTSRRFDNKGVGYMFKLMLKCWFNRNNPDFYKEEHNYWS